MIDGVDRGRIFVYGTLREDPDHDLYRVLARSSTFVGDATVNGRLYNLGTYPGLVLSDDPGSRVRGEVYEFQPELEAQTLRILDEYEGCDANDQTPHEYRRELVQLRFPNGETARAWAYLLNRDPAGLEMIRGGDYLEWRRNVGAA